MSVEAQVREALRGLTPHPEITIEVEALRRGARRRAWVRAALFGCVVTVVVVAGLGAIGSWDRERPPDPTPGPEGMSWERVPDMPLSPRWNPLTIWTGSEALVLGGLDSKTEGGVPPSPNLRDGAAFDLDSASWRQIADAPIALGQCGCLASVVVDDVVILARGRDWIAYDIARDTWRELPHPAPAIPQATLAVDADRGLVYALDKYVREGDNAPVQVFDLSTDEWSSLPASTIEPQLEARTLVMTESGLVVMGDELFPRRTYPGQQDTRAEVWDGEEWQRFRHSDVNGGEWHWTGERIISTIRIREGDSNRDGRHDYRAGALDPATGHWSELPWLPPDRTRLLAGGWPSAEGALVFGEGHLYDDAEEASRPIPPPDKTLFRSGVLLGGGRLMSFGGYHADPTDTTSRGPSVIEPTNEAWIVGVG